MSHQQTNWEPVRVGAGFRTVLPPAARERLGIAPGDELIAASDADGVHLYTLEQAARRAAAILAAHVDPARTLSEELLAERRDEAAHG